MDLQTYTGNRVHFADVARGCAMRALLLSKSGGEIPELPEDHKVGAHPRPLPLFAPLVCTHAIPRHQASIPCSNALYHPTQSQSSLHSPLFYLPLCCRASA